MLKKDTELQSFLSNSCIYIIAQRPVIFFQDINQDGATGDVTFVIRQEGKNSSLSCRLPLFQNGLATNKSKYIYLGLSSYEKVAEKTQVLKKCHVLKIFQGDELNYYDELVAWLSPEMLLHNFCRGILDVIIEGDVREFLKYKVRDRCTV